MKYLKVDAYDGMCFFGRLVFFAPVALLVRTQAGISEGQFFLLQVLLSAVIALGELPTGYLTDRIGYRSSLILSQLLLLTARGTLLAAYLFRSLPLFVLEAVIEGISACLSSGTGSAYLYGGYTLGSRRKIAHSGLHAETGAFRMGVLSLPSDRFARFGNPAWSGVRTANFAAFGSWSEALL